VSVETAVRTAPPTLARRAVAWSTRTSRLTVPRLERGDWVFLVAAFLLSRLTILALGIVGASLFPELGPHNTFALHPIALGGTDWLRIYVRFDSGWYIGVSHGYPPPGPQHPNWLAEWEFFPLYPMALHPLSLLLGVLHVPGNNDALAGILVSHAALFGGLVYLYRLTSGELPVEAARRAVIYILIFPASLFLSAVYPEGLFLLLTVAAFYHARRRQWAAAGLLATGALLTRPQGLLLLLPLGLEFIAAARAGEMRRWEWRRALWLGLPLVALGCYALYSHAETGLWLAYVTSSSVAWGHRLTPPVYPLARFLLSPMLGNAFSFDFTAANFAAAVGFLALSVVAWRRLPPAYGLWVAISVLTPLSTSGHYTYSMMRYMSVVFPAFMALAAWSVGQQWARTGTMTEPMTPAGSELRDRVIVVPSLLLLAVYVVMFTDAIAAGI
jgi:hypothetical protein